MKKLFYIIATFAVFISSCQTNESNSDNEGAYWKDTYSILDSTFTFALDSTGVIEASFTTPASAVKAPLIIMQSVMDKDLSLGKPDGDTTVSKPYKDIAIGLAQRGVATFRFGSAINQHNGKRKETDGFMDALLRMNEDLNSAIDIAKTIESIDTTRIYLLSVNNLFIPEVIKQHPTIKGVIIASTPSRPLMDGLMEMMRTLVKKDTIWESVLRETEIQYANLQKMGTKDFNDSIKLPMNLSKEEWAKLKDYSLAEEIKQISVPVLILQGNDISLPQKEFDTWEEQLAGRVNTVCKQYKDLTLLFITPNDVNAKNKSRHVPAYVVNDIAEWIESIK